MQFKDEYPVSYFSSENKHCPTTSDCRDLISDQTKCHTTTILSHFEKGTRIEVPTVACHCCYNCIRAHSDDGFQVCGNLLSKFFPCGRRSKISKSVAAELADALKQLFETMDMVDVKVESSLVIPCESFTKDVLKMVDELQSHKDIIHFWHVDADLAMKVFAVINEVLNSMVYGYEESTDAGEEQVEDDEDIDDSDCEDWSSDSSDSYSQSSCDSS